MFDFALTIMVIVVVGALLLGSHRLRALDSSTIFCPYREMLVEVRAGLCYERETGRLVGPSGQCSRECLREREIARMRTQANGHG